MARVDPAVRSRQLVEAARDVLSREGVANTSLRAVAAEAGVPLGTMQYVFPTRESLLRAVIEDVVAEIEGVFADAEHTGAGLERALRDGLRAFWDRLAGNRNLQIMQYELTTYALRAEGQEELARWQYESYTGVVASWCERAAESAGERAAIPLDRLARIVVAAVDGLILQYACDPNTGRAERDVETTIDMLVALAAPRPA